MHRIQALPQDRTNLPLPALFLVESPHCGPEVWPLFDAMYRAIRRSNARRPTAWRTREAAVRWVRTHAPWRAFHPEVLDIIEVRAGVGALCCVGVVG